MFFGVLEITRSSGWSVLFWRYDKIIVPKFLIIENKRLGFALRVLQLLAAGTALYMIFGLAQSAREDVAEKCLCFVLWSDVIRLLTSIISYSYLFEIPLYENVLETSEFGAVQKWVNIVESYFEKCSKYVLTDKHRLQHSRERVLQSMLEGPYIWRLECLDSSFTDPVLEQEFQRIGPSRGNFAQEAPSTRN